MNKVNYKKNYFNTQEARTSKITRKDGKEYTLREDKMRFFFPDEWKSFYDVLKKKQKITFEFLINTGARISECRGMRVADVDFERNSVIIRNTKTRNKDGTRKIRVISISGKFVKFLKSLIKSYNLKLEDSFPVLSIPASNIAMNKALKIVGIKDRENFSVHSVRKTLEVWLLTLGIDSLKVAKHMGHTIQIAQKYYVSPDTFSWEDKNQIREIIGNLYSNREVY
jgi:integrase